MMFRRTIYVSFNTQPPEGGCNGKDCHDFELSVSTHSRLKAAAQRNVADITESTLFQHTAA